MLFPAADLAGASARRNLNSRMNEVTNESKSNLFAVLVQIRLLWDAEVDLNYQNFSRYNDTSFILGIIF